MMPKQTREHQPRPGDWVPDSNQESNQDISQLATTYLVPPPPRGATRSEQIRQHEAEIGHLLELVAIVEQAITALVFRLHIATDQQLQEALEHNRRDLQRYQDELVSLRTEHEQALGRLQAQK
jgi:hypothetical protein